VYGRIVLNRDHSFAWTGYTRLTPSVIPENTLSTGRLQFDTYISGDLAARYDGAVSFVFELRNGTAVPVRFLYRFTGDGLQLTWIPEELRRGVTIDEEPVSPTVLFFRLI
jgi:hypothetical protein